MIMPSSTTFKPFSIHPKPKPKPKYQLPLDLYSTLHLQYTNSTTPRVHDEYPNMLPNILHTSAQLPPDPYNLQVASTYIPQKHTLSSTHTYHSLPHKTNQSHTLKQNAHLKTAS
ncbi:hypothetical protein MCOR25_005281 [Pyricularia grisea]|nr:hypothetical protein MCOR25_005281 [Pyricularia grisea]